MANDNQIIPEYYDGLNYSAWEVIILCWETDIFSFILF